LTVELPSRTLTVMLIRVYADARAAAELCGALSVARVLAGARR